MLHQKGRASLSHAVINGAGLDGQINNLQRIVAKSGEEETLAFGVDGEVIEATLDSVQRNGVNELEAGFLGKAGTHPQGKQENGRASHSMVTCCRS